MRRFSFSSDARGVWTLTGTVGKKPTQFCNLPAALEFARKDAGGEEADIELWAEGLYMFVHQEKGWPHCLCVRAPEGGGDDREYEAPCGLCRPWRVGCRTTSIPSGEPSEGDPTHKRPSSVR
jgi:hypothetical protein